MHARREYTYKLCNQTWEFMIVYIWIHMQLWLCLCFLNVGLYEIQSVIIIANTCNYSTYSAFYGSIVFHDFISTHFVVCVLWRRYRSRWSSRSVCADRERSRSSLWSSPQDRRTSSSLCRMVRTNKQRHRALDIRNIVVCKCKHEF